MRALISIITTLAILWNPSLSYSSAEDEIEEYSNIVKSGRYACEEQFAVLFGNGIANDAQDSKNSRIELEKQLEGPINTAGLEDKTVYNNVYNPTYLWSTADWVESVAQKLGANVSAIGQTLPDISSLSKDRQIADERILAVTYLSTISTSRSMNC